MSLKKILIYQKNLFRLQINTNLDDFTARYNDLKRIIDDTIGKIAQVDRQNTESRLYLNQVQNTTNIINDELDDLSKIESNHQEAKEAMDKVAKEVDDSFKNLRKSIDILSNLEGMLLDDELNTTLINSIKYKVREAVAHTAFLVKLADSYEE